MIKNSTHVFMGLLLDISISLQESGYLSNAHNIRLTARENETLLTVTNERGPEEVKDKENKTITFVGLILGYCTLNLYLVIFTKDTHNNTNPDYIYRIDLNIKELKQLYNGNLNFNVSYPIYTLGSYESEIIQKIYWTDNYNLPRVINIVSDKTFTDSSFDFVQDLKLQEEVNITKMIGTSGLFSPGVILYSFTYYNLYGLESNVFYTTPLQYISYKDRGASPEDVVANSFKIKIDNIDTRFDYIRIYSIYRTSLNGDPEVKRLLDIPISSSTTTVYYTDTGVNGDTIDATTLLYIGGEEIFAKTLCLKDGTLFLGNIKINRQQIDKATKTLIKESYGKSSVESSVINVVSDTPLITGDYIYYNTLNIALSAGFKWNDWYRLGVLFLYKNGKWSEPIWLGDFKQEAKPEIVESGNTVTILTPSFHCTNSDTTPLKTLSEKGYVKYRPLVVYPDLSDRIVICQGIANPTLYTKKHRNDTKDIYAQASWSFRFSNSNPGQEYYVQDPDYEDYVKKTLITGGSYLLYKNDEALSYLQLNTDLSDTGDSSKYFNHSSDNFGRAIEIEGNFADEDKYYVDWDVLTLNSPDIEFDTSINSLDLTGLKARVVGRVECTKTFSDISITTSSATLGSAGLGFVNLSFIFTNGETLCSGLFYDDVIADDNSSSIYQYSKCKGAVKWLVYLWNTQGSLNNDFLRPSDMGTLTAVLSKKIISNLHYCKTTFDSSSLPVSASYSPLLFSSDEVTLLKFGTDCYYGNINEILIPLGYCCKYFCADNALTGGKFNTIYNSKTSILSNNWYQLDVWESGTGVVNKDKSNISLWIPGYGWKEAGDGNVADNYIDLAVKKQPVNIKYKSTPHIVLNIGGSSSKLPTAWIGNVNLILSNNLNSLPLIEIYRDTDIETLKNTMFGGLTDDALKANQWLVAGEPRAIKKDETLLDFELNFIYGDTWYQRYDCLKTYPFTSEDQNQVVEIASFPCETRVNLDGRYDRNRALVNNLYMTPTNFNLINRVYTLKNNYYSYRILDEDYYKLVTFPNEFTWSTEKAAASTVDPWTQVTLASTYDIDGSYGLLTSINSFLNELYCFQEKGVSNILFNSRVQVNSSDGVPILITNNYKVDGVKYISTSLGSINPSSICATSNGLYFVDTTSNDLYLLSALNALPLNVSFGKNMSMWFKNQDNTEWKPNSYSTKVFYDSLYNDVYITALEESLVFSEKLNEFTSFMSYGSLPSMFNIGKNFYCIKEKTLYQMFAGKFNMFFGAFKPFDITFKENGKVGKEDLTLVDKTFTNLSIYADRWKEGDINDLSSSKPFDFILVTNEYQNTGEVSLETSICKPSNLKKKFRVWNVLIPRDRVHKLDRIRNTWCNIKLGTNTENTDMVNLHSIESAFII